MNHIALRYHANYIGGAHLTQIAESEKETSASWANRPGPGGLASSDFEYGNDRQINKVVIDEDQGLL